MNYIPPKFCAPITLALLLPLSGCGISTPSDESQIKSAVISGLKDPDSAIIDTIKIVGHQGETACVSVNAKNSFGGYTGFQTAFLVKEGSWRLTNIMDVPLASCVEKFENMYGSDRYQSFVFKTAPITTNLKKEDDLDQMVEFSFTITLRDPESFQAVTDQEQKIRSEVLLLTSDTTAASISTIEGKDEFAEKIKAIVRNILGEPVDIPVGKVMEVAITDMAIR